MTNAQRVFVLECDQEIQRFKERLLKERALSPDQRIKRLPARLRERRDTKGQKVSDEWIDWTSSAGVN